MCGASLQEDKISVWRCCCNSCVVHLFVHQMSLQIADRRGKGYLHFLGRMVWEFTQWRCGRECMQLGVGIPTDYRSPGAPKAMRGITGLMVPPAAMEYQRHQRAELLCGSPCCN
ncbi:hypothetical protein Y1Q_0012164 [Alligator mississippiensis]|uniref:Uncharacterized protein n=1 Tax=Alligator mississippiensis TaxID=8496 RepID=A0A151N525_ALLMI|nr:hypothetical protein Y1Q_0012164 [Alligator mississippiensis]